MSTAPLADGSTRNEYVATGGQTTFPYTFWAYAEDHIDVYQNGTPLTLTADYTISAVQDVNGGNIVLNTGATLNDDIVIALNPDLERLTEFQTSGSFRASALNLELTYDISNFQWLRDKLDRAVTLADSVVFTGSLDLPTPNAGKALIWNATADGLTNSVNDVDTVVATAAASAAAAAISEGNAATSESNAATSESNAATSESNAATSEANALAAASAVAIKWNFDSATAMVDPGTGDLRMDNATISSVTNLAVSSLTADTGNPDLSAFIATLDDATNAVRATLTIRKSGAPATFAVFSVTGAITDNGTWLQIPVTYVDGAGTLSDTDPLYVGHAISGSDGPGAGDLLAANNLSDVANAATSLSNLGGIGAATTDTLTNKTFDANGTGNSLSNVDVADLAVGTDGELITWDSSGNPATVAVGSSGQVLTSNGAGAAPTMQTLGATARTYTKQQNFAEATLTDAANISWNLDDAQTAKVTLAGNRTLDNPTNLVAGGTYVLRIIQDGTGTRTLAYGSAYKFPGGTAPTLSTAAGAEDIITFYCDGTNMNGVFQGNFS